MLLLVQHLPPREKQAVIVEAEIPLMGRQPHAPEALDWSEGRAAQPGVRQPAHPETGLFR